MRFTDEMEQLDRVLDRYCERNNLPLDKSADDMLAGEVDLLADEAKFLKAWSVVFEDIINTAEGGSDD
jgi:hypothetical protein